MGQRSQLDAHRDQREEPRRRDQSQERPNAIDKRLYQQRPGQIRRRAKHEHRPISEHVEIRPGDRGANEIRHHPCLHSFDLAGRDRLLQPVHVALAAGKDHAAHGVLMQRFNHR